MATLSDKAAFFGGTMEGSVGGSICQRYPSTAHESKSRGIVDISQKN